MDINGKIGLIKKGTLEIINLEELKEKLEKSHPIAYTGYEPSGKIHLGHAITVMKLKQLQELGFKIKILLADYHAYLNGKGTIEEIEKTAKYNEKCFKALGLSENTEFVLGSSFQTKPEYTDKIYNLATITTLVRAKRSMDKVSRSSENPKVADAMYPLMQIADMVALNVDVALGGMEQRKIQMLARENLPKINKTPPVCIHTPLLHGLDGDEKMSSSKGNFIAIDDSESEIRKKINKSFCPMKEIEGNPIIELATHFIFTNQNKIIIERPEKFGGNLKLTEKELVDIYAAGELHPMDLKNAVSSFLISYLASVREYMENN
ncbi:tyrosine--tRNA ligase [Methanobrevibacter arboriphilus]|jgi:tyrosyl-tRNA synthetase|uniref:Tyrosine--tRNA ligase n=1 Tax=Methanobrevibacter arboriphilus TaxID=39441 RepID=A0ACA8R3I3_METAZ|nr:tyrosine--tRNA ligase [Methanobrevibacter arboriphilus]MCC7561322.1 tyrosine--tRNA ligase [Methanobrevibacter arboriphilus]BBL61792.1 tyrosine--tRNA ligase [Methanobrevibacter arboriphilus]GLI12856.1 tyrosine--tRNA ligase [Methanobrevibacter arboriphilus]